MNKIEELESRIEELECELKELRGVLGLSRKVPDLVEEVYSTGEGPAPLPIKMKPAFEKEQVLMRKPIMYLYNFTGDTLNCNVDFKSNVIADSVPEIRKDNKLVFSLDSDSFINGKYGSLYYEFDITGNEPKSSSYTYVKNNKSLDYDLGRLCNILGLNTEETVDFVAYWSLELKRLDDPFFKCEIFDESKLEKLFPIEIEPTPNYFIRRYIKFVPVDKLGKGNITVEQFRGPLRSGALRCVEWGGFIAGSKTVK